MRQAFCNSLVKQANEPEFVFLTGDLGFKALEPLQAAMAERFINAGVAEQNMVSVAAGLARGGFRPWTYSIAPFQYARPFEQIRNDVCLHGLPVVLVGNGGGYGYGVMGSSHHALEDYGCLLTLPHVRAFVPAFDADIPPMISSLMRISGPAYLRLGLSEEPNGWPVPEYASWRRLLAGNGPVLAAVGPVVGTVLSSLSQMPEAHRPDVWVVSELPIAELPSSFLESLHRTCRLVVIEEHTAHGGFGQMLVHSLAAAGEPIHSFTHRHALGYVSGLYGSQKFHRAECGLDPASIVAAVTAR
jgi:transketolase